MSTFSNIVKKSILLVILSTLFLPILQSKFHPIQLEALKGDVVIPSDPGIQDTSWFSGNFQEKQDVYLNSSFGFRSWCVRLNSQLAFWFFNKAKANGVIIGKDNYLFEKNYITAYTGKDFIGKDNISKIINRITFISDTLTKLNKQLIVILAPGKASFYPEYIPPIYGSATAATNYKFLAKGLSESAINYIDFNKWFIQQKQVSKYPMYPKYGIHWSIYGSVLAGDSIIKKIEYLRKIDVPNLIYNNIDLKQPNDMDYDVANGMNLLFRLPSFDMAYPKITSEVDTAKTKPSVVVISDSFYWSLYSNGISNSFKNDHFWYYNKQVYPESATNEVLTENLDYKNEIEKHDVFIVMATEANLSRIGWGFFEDMEHYFKGDNYVQDRKKRKELKRSILGDKNWMKDIEVKANKKGISIDSMINLDVLWIINQQSKK